MKYSDEQRIAKICETTEKLLNFVMRNKGEYDGSKGVV